MHTNITSGSLYISVNDLVRIVQLLQNGGELDGVRILTEDSVQLMMMPQHLIEGSSVTGESPYGLCITTVDDLPGGTWYGHQGMWQGLTSNAYFQPDTGLCIAIIANGYNANKKSGVATIARAFMEKAQELVELGFCGRNGICQRRKFSCLCLVRAYLLSRSRERSKEGQRGRDLSRMNLSVYEFS